MCSGGRRVCRQLLVDYYNHYASNPWFAAIAVADITSGSYSVSVSIVSCVMRLEMITNTRPPTNTTHKLFCSCDLDLDPMTLTYENDPDILKRCLHAKNEVS